jgi:hypothetical protein
MRRMKTDVPMRWYGALVLGNGVVQCVEARTLPRPQSILEDAPEGARESIFEIMTDPVRASWPSR